MPSQINLFKAALAARTPQIGLWLGLADAYCAEICAGAGFDWLLIDGEHAPNDLRTILSQLQALAAYPVHAAVRPPSGDPNLIKQLLDIGAQTLLIPMVETEEQAQALVRAVRYPPAGIRGVGAALARAAEWNRNTSYLAEADREVCLLVQIESRRGLEHLPQIAAIEGVDGIFIGPADLSASLGHRGNPGHPEVQRAIDEAIGVIGSTGKAAGILAAAESAARRYMELGCTFIAVGIDVSLLARASEELARKFKTAGAVRSS
jgi:4-hydroxy-2-oxoheptanedioate aldolase